jgi:hypothetical protein
MRAYQALGANRDKFSFALLDLDDKLPNRE